MRRVSEGKKLRAWILVEPAWPTVKVWGLTTAERLKRALEIAGIPREQIHIGSSSRVRALESPLLLLRSDYVFDERLIHALVGSDRTALLAPGRGKVVAVHLEGTRLALALRLLLDPEGFRMEEVDLRFVEPSQLVPAYTALLRKADTPYLLPAKPESVAEIEERIFAASYKGVTDLVTKWVWPLPARLVTYRLASWGVHPNVVTGLSWILVVGAAWCFVQGYWGLGLVVAWCMTFLDTVDGKLARVTLTSSRTGHILDHGLDLLHPPFWYLAWGAGLPPNIPWLQGAIAVIVGGYVVGRLIEGVFLWAFGMEIHSWRPVDSLFRTITARRNPNLILLTAGFLAGRPDGGLILVAAWTLFSLGFHAVRLLQAFLWRWWGHSVRPWQEVGEGSLGGAVNPSTQSSESPV